MNKQPEAKKQDVYESPRIVHKGKLKQFAGSPLGETDGNADSILGLPGND